MLSEHYLLEYELPNCSSCHDSIGRMHLYYDSGFNPASIGGDSIRQYSVPATSGSRSKRISKFCFDQSRGSIPPNRMISFPYYQLFIGIDYDLGEIKDLYFPITPFQLNDSSGQPIHRGGFTLRCDISTSPFAPTSIVIPSTKVWEELVLKLRGIASQKCGFIPLIVKDKEPCC